MIAKVRVRSATDLHIHIVVHRDQVALVLHAPLELQSARLANKTLEERLGVELQVKGRVSVIFLAGPGLARSLSRGRGALGGRAFLFWMATDNLWSSRHDVKGVGDGEV